MIQQNNAAPIALLDSGAGGIGVLREVQKLLPSEQLLYFGDTANAPYGEKPPNVVRSLALQAAERLIGQSIKALVLACNTATAIAAAELRNRHPHLPIIGMEPALCPAVAACVGKAHPRVLVLATAATLRGEKFDLLRKKYEKTATVVALPAPGIVRLVEAGLEDSPEMDAYLHELFAPLTTPPDAVVLGCTHFPFAKKALQRALGKSAPFFDGAKGTAKELRRRLSQQGLLSPPHAKGGVLLSAGKPDALPLLIRLYRSCSF